MRSKAYMKWKTAAVSLLQISGRARWTIYCVISLQQQDDSALTLLLIGHHGPVAHATRLKAVVEAEDSGGVRGLT